MLSDYSIHHSSLKIPEYLEQMLFGFIIHAYARVFNHGDQSATAGTGTFLKRMKV